MPAPLSWLGCFFAIIFFSSSSDPENAFDKVLNSIKKQIRFKKQPDDRNVSESRGRYAFRSLKTVRTELYGSAGDRIKKRARGSGKTDRGTGRGKQKTLKNSVGSDIIKTHILRTITFKCEDVGLC